jgi:hypothetical protein
MTLDLRIFLLSKVLLRAWIAQLVYFLAMGWTFLHITKNVTRPMGMQHRLFDEA